MNELMLDKVLSVLNGTASSVVNEYVSYMIRASILELVVAALLLVAAYFFKKKVVDKLVGKECTYELSWTVEIAILIASFCFAYDGALTLVNPKAMAIHQILKDITPNR